VRAVARAHGGNVTVSAKMGNGSEFELTLPSPTGTRPATASAAGTDHEATLIADTEEESIRR